MGLMQKVVGVSVGLLVAALLLPTALSTIANASIASSMENVDPAVITVFQVLLPILAVIGIAVYFLRGR